MEGEVLDKIMKIVYDSFPKTMLAGRLRSKLFLECVRKNLEEVKRYLKARNILILARANNDHVSFGERGRLLYTSLFNYAMPLIRYDVGDICVPSDELCSCGRGLPMIKHIEGRVDDFVKTPSGRVFLSYNLDY